jgi:hypothetical protein
VKRGEVGNLWEGDEKGGKYSRRGRGGVSK